MAIIAQGELVGNPFAHNFQFHSGSKDISIGQQRQVRIVAALNEKTGEMEFKPITLAPIAVSLFSHIPLACGTIFDRALQKPSLETAKKKGASTTGVNMEAVWQNRGGKPNDHPLKTKGFAFKSTASEIAKERKRKREVEKAIFYQGHP